MSYQPITYPKDWSISMILLIEEYRRLVYEKDVYLQMKKNIESLKGKKFSDVRYI